MNRGSLDAAQIEFLERIFAALPRLIEDNLCSFSNALIAAVSGAKRDQMVN